MKLTVLLFAAAKEAAGTEAADVELPEGASVADLRTRLAAEFPQLQPLAETLLVAVNQEFANDDRVVRVADEVAVFPPVSGG